jgi:hypothetical protein
LVEKYYLIIKPDFIALMEMKSSELEKVVFSDLKKRPKEGLFAA